MDQPVQVHLAGSHVGRHCVGQWSQDLGQLPARDEGSGSDQQVGVAKGEAGLQGLGAVAGCHD